MSEFDPYHIWLGIPETERPISKYRLLAIADFELDRDVISAAAERQTVFLRTLQAGEHEVLVAQDYKEAVKWYRLAAKQGNDVAQFNLGLKYAHGVGVPQSYQETYNWLSLAAASGHKAAKESLESLKTKLSPEQLIEAQKRATKLFKQMEERNSP